MTIRRKFIGLALTLFMSLSLTACADVESPGLSDDKAVTEQTDKSADSEGISEDNSEMSSFAGDSETEILNDGEPYFTEDEIARASESFYEYGGFDSLGRPTGVLASINSADLPKGERNDGDELQAITPPGWKQVQYGADYVETGYLYNRGHLCMYALGGETSERNIITQTRYLNATLQLPYEEEALSYVRSYKDCQLLYRVTPVYDGDNLVASGVIMEALSLDSLGTKYADGSNLKFCVYLANVQPGIEIDYSDGSSSLIDDYDGEYATSSYYSSSDSYSSKSDKASSNIVGSGSRGSSDEKEQTYILNTNSKKFHYESCSSVNQMSDSNKQVFTGKRSELIADGYSPCGACNP